MIKKLFLFSLYTFIILVNYLTFCNGKISGTRECGDPECSSAVSSAITLMKYHPNQDCMLMFPSNAKVNVMSKGIGELRGFWEIEYNGKRGFAPSRFLRETKLFKNDGNTYEVPTQCGKEPKIEKEKVLSPEPEKIPIVPASAVEPFEMIDGTKIFNDDVNTNIEDVVKTGGGDRTLETPEIPAVEQPSLEAKSNDESPDSSTDQPENDDYEGDELIEEEQQENNNEDEGEESEEIVDSVDSTEIVPSELNSKNESVDSSTSDPIISENVSNEVENELNESENETLPIDSEDEKIETVTENVSQQERTAPKQEDPSIISEQINPEPPQNMYATPIPNEIPRPILEDQMILEATTATPFLEPIAHNLQKETIQSISEKENSTIEQNIISETPPVPSVEENNATVDEETKEAAVLEKLASVEEDEVKTENASVEIEKQSESDEKSKSNELVPDPVAEQPIVEEIALTYGTPPSLEPNETSSVIKDSESVVQTIDNKIDELGETKEEEPIGPEYVEEKPAIEIPISYPPPPPAPSNQLPPPQLEIPEPNPLPPVSQEIPEPDSLPTVPQENATPPLLTEPEPESPGLFASIYGKIFGFGNDNALTVEKQNIPLDEELERILYPEKFQGTSEPSQRVMQEINPIKQTDADEEFCENLSPNSCPKSAPSGYTPAKLQPMVSHFHSAHTDEPENLTECGCEDNLKVFLDGLVKSDVVTIYLIITSATVLAFIFGYYCINQRRKEAPLITKLNVMERNLMVSKKENTLLQGELDDIRQKLVSIEDNSFGSNEMVIALKIQLDESENQKIDYQLQVSALEKELESATEAGLELNRMVADLLNNQSGSESIISSVEELQKQLNEQQETIYSINATLAEKSRDNSELQVFLNEQKKQFDDDLSVLQSLNENLTVTNGELNKKIIEMTELLEVTVNEALKSKSDEIVKLNKELNSIKKRFDDSQRKLAKAESRCQVLDEYLKNSKNDGIDTKEAYDFIQLKSEALAANKERELFKERLEIETDARKLIDDHLKHVSEEVSNLKKEYHVAEKEKVEAQTRLEVLSGYFKEKETQLQKELSIKEAMWLQQQGEKTSTIERVQSMQDEVQNLKSQNDALRAEIEAQAAAHKTQIATLDSRAHEEWLNAKQAKRKLEEVRSEAAGLRRKLTTYGESGVDATGLVNGIDGNLNAPSPIMMVGDNNTGPSMLGVLPPPPFMPPPFMGGPPPPFMPPPFMPGEMRPPPLGRLLSPPPNRYSPNIDDRDRYSPDRSPGRYSPDARYNYNDVLSPYETETDFSPPPSPPPRHGGYRDNRGYKTYSSPPPPPQSDNRNKKSKGGLSSGSTDSIPRRRGGGGGVDKAGPNIQNGSNKV